MNNAIDAIPEVFYQVIIIDLRKISTALSARKTPSLSRTQAKPNNHQGNGPLGMPW